MRELCVWMDVYWLCLVAICVYLSDIVSVGLAKQASSSLLQTLLDVVVVVVSDI
ncbi:hypothetical protein BD408DRAFT_411915 [Parasitella parasitica]|nr:hypothetical protein BD408DRAFT_411915 [Parasitella parasitica]